MGGRSRTSSSTTTSQDIDTTQVGIEGVEGVGIAAAGDVEFNQEVTDLGAVQGAFDVVGGSLDFAGEFGGEAFDFASDIARQAGQTSQQAVETSRQAIATVATQGQSDIAGINSRTIGFIIAGLAAIFIIPALIRSN